MNAEKSSETKTILALHGFTGTGADFDCPKSFCPKNLIWETPDLPPEALAPLCKKLRERWNALGKNPRILLGYSMGGRIALHLAREISWRANDELVLVSASPGIADARERKTRRDCDDALAAEIENFPSAEKFYEKWSEKPLIATQRRLPSPWREQLLARRAASDRNVWAEYLRRLGTGKLPSLWENLAEIAAPKITLAVGEEDFKFRAIAEKMQAKLPRSRLVVVPASGHSPHLENAEFFAKSVF